MLIWTFLKEEKHIKTIKLQMKKRLFYKQSKIGILDQRAPHWLISVEEIYHERPVTVISPHKRADTMKIILWDLITKANKAEYSEIILLRQIMIKAIPRSMYQVYERSIKNN